MNFRKIVPIPLTTTTAYLAGVIIGDGHLHKGTKSKTNTSPHYRVNIQVVEREYAEFLLDSIKQIISTKTKIHVRRVPNRKPLYIIQVVNKNLHYFFANSIGIPTGAKSRIVNAPDIIKQNSDEIKRHFLAGLFDTDGGRRGKTIGYTSASCKLVKDIQDLLLDFGIFSWFDYWYNKKYNNFYYGLKIKRNCIDSFLKHLPIRNYTKFKAAVPERTNGPETNATTALFG